MKYLIFFLFALAITLGVAYFVPSMTKQTVGRAILDLNKTLYKWDYHISAFNVHNYTKIVLIFEKNFNFSCIKSIKIDNITINASTHVLNNNMLEINLNKRLQGVHNLEIDFCDRRLIDVLTVQ